MKQAIERRFRDNVDRVKKLVDIYDNKLSSTGRGRRPVASSDLLRAAVVFLHATLEDLIRSLERWKLPAAPKEVIDDIPLVTPTGQSRPYKFYLGELVAHGGKSVAEVITESVAAYLDRATYNDTGEIAARLTGIGIDVAQVNGRFADLEEMMKRRHHIVHQADANTTAGRGHHAARSISQGSVQTWIDAVDEFATAVLAQV